MLWNSALISPSRAVHFPALILVFALILAGFSTQSFTQSAGDNVLVQAQSALDANRPQTAIDLLSQHLKLHPADDPAHLLLAEAFVMTRQAEQAENEYQAVLKHVPNNYIALAGLGELYASTGQTEKSEPLLAKAVKHSQHEPQLRIEWAQVLTRLHRFQEASTALTNVAAPATPGERIGFFRLKAAIAAGLGTSAQAASQMESALAVRPHDSDLQLATAIIQLQAGNSQRATTLANTAFTQTHSPEAGITLLQAQLATHTDIHPTLASLRSLELSLANELSLRQQLAQILIAHQDFIEAVVDLTRAAQFDPSDPDLRFNLALAQFKSGAARDALSSAEKAKQLRDTADVESLLGDIYESSGDNLAAIKSYQAAVTMDPNNEAHQLALALEFIRHRNFEPAKLVLQQAAHQFPKSWRVLVALGMVEYFVGTKPAASAILLRAAAVAPDPQLAFRYLGDIELDESTAPDPAAVTRLCSFADAHPKAAREQLYCGALLLHTDYASRDKSRVVAIVHRLTIAATDLPNEAAPHCELGRAYAWMEDWKPAQRESEICAKLNPDSAQAHYRLSQIYHHTGQTDRARDEIKLYKDASARLAEENEQHEDNLKTFLYTIQNQATGTK